VAIGFFFIAQEQYKMNNETFFLHGYESSGGGTKGQFFNHHFPYIHCPDFNGSLHNRLDQLHHLCSNKQQLTFIGSSYGGLMAVCYSLAHPERVTRLILMAPALNFEDYQAPQQKITIPTLLIIGKSDTITPADIVLPLAEASFSALDIHLADDDHMLHGTFEQLDWQSILANHPL
jgi:pimeloyl-ACP methyl ester carboxylesterase